MPTLDVFKNDAFAMANLTASINALPYQPSRIGQMNLFETVGINTPTAFVEINNGVLMLVPTSPRGGQPSINRGEKRKAVPFAVPHIELVDQVKADDVLGLRAFGSETEMEAVENLVNRRMMTMKQSVEVTAEYHRIGALTGLVKDADGSTTITDLFTAFGVSQQTTNFALATATTKVRSKCLAAKRQIEDALGMAAYDHIHALCSSTFFEALIEHDDVKDAYHRFQDSVMLRNDPRSGFEYGGIVFEEYRGGIGNVSFITAGDARIFPVGVQSLYQSIYAPGDFVETAGTTGLPIYAKQELQKFGKGVDLLVQSNPLMICTRPRVLVRGY
jgi:hypothetical protein